MFQLGINRKAKINYHFRDGLFSVLILCSFQQHPHFHQYKHDNCEKCIVINKKEKSFWRICFFSSIIFYYFFFFIFRVENLPKTHPIALRYLLPFNESIIAVPFLGLSFDSNTRINAFVYKCTASYK